MWSMEKAQSIVDYADKHSDDKAKECFNLKNIDSIRRARNLITAENRITNMPRILVLDIETAPLKAYVWGKWKQTLYHSDQMIQDWYCLTWACKWLHEDKVYSGRVKGKEAKNEDDKRILMDLIKLMDDADFIIAHNGDKFDFPRINGRLALNGLKPISPYVSIDTCKLARRNFGFTSNKLDDILKSFGLEGKTSTGFTLWRDAVEGSDKAIKEMEEYNINDVIILEELYKVIRPYIKGLPSIMQSVTGMKESKACPICGGQDLKADGHYRTNVSIFPAYRCGDCGAYSRGRKSIVLDKNEVVPVAR